MKRVWMLLFAAVLCLSMMGFAQSTDMSSQSAGQQGTGMHHGDADHDRMKMDPQEMVNHLDQQLSLTADQKSKITTILENSNKHSQELMSNNSGDKKANHEAMRQLHENTHAQIRATLTSDQQTKFDSMMKEHEKSGMNHHHDQDSSSSSTTDNPK
jgi:hypothetical protein